MSFDHRPQMQKYKQSYWIHKDFHLSPVIRVYRKSQPVTFHLISRCLFFTRTPSSSLNVCGFQNSVWAHTGAAGRSSSGVCGSEFIEIIIIQVMHPHKPSRWQQCGISNFNALINMYVCERELVVMRFEKGLREFFLPYKYSNTVAFKY